MGSSQGSICIYDTAARQKFYELRSRFDDANNEGTLDADPSCKEGITAIRFSPDNRFVVAGTNNGAFARYDFSVNENVKHVQELPFGMF